MTIMIQNYNLLFDYYYHYHLIIHYFDFSFFVFVFILIIIVILIIIIAFRKIKITFIIVVELLSLFPSSLINFKFYYGFYCFYCCYWQINYLAFYYDWLIFFQFRGKYCCLLFFVLFYFDSIFKFFHIKKFYVYQ